MSDVVRVGYISAINYKEGTAQVVYKDRDNSVSPFMPLWANEWNPPEVDTMVYVIHLPNGGTRGMILVPPYTDGNRPVEGAAGIWRKDFGNGNYIRYDQKEKRLDIKSDSINVKSLVIAGNMTIEGNVHVTGDFTVDGNYPA